MTEEARKKAMRIINARAMSKGEMIDKLTQKGIEPEDAESAADWLEEMGAIDDRSYAASVVEYYGANGYGTMRIKSELYRRKIDKELWEEALLYVPDADDAIDRFIAAKLRGKTPDGRELRRVSDALSRRGFSWDEINDGLRRYGSTGEDFD